MGNTFVVDGVTYKIMRNPYTNGPMIVRVDNKTIDNRKEVCRKFLYAHGWTESMFKNKNTNTLERRINEIVNGDYVPDEIGESNTEAKGPKKNKDKKLKQSKRRDDIPNPCEEQVKHWLKQWEKLEDYVAQEKAINNLFNSQYRPNNSLENILVKCSVLNDFYSTNIFKIYPVAKHIYGLKIDDRLVKGDPTLVDDISKLQIGKKNKNFYSFASKYCSHHNQVEYPIYDSYVHKVLWYFRRVDNFDEFEENDLKNYVKFKNILIKFKEFYKLGKFSLKELDRYLWLSGKKYFPKSYKSKSK